MSRFVLDCSITISWCFEDEANSYSEKTLELLRTMEGIVPWIWPMEIANVLLVGERRGRLTEAESTRFLSLLRGIPIFIDNTPPNQTAEEVLSLGRQYGLSSYDAAYLELAMRDGVELATLDDLLRAAAQAAGVGIVSP